MSVISGRALRALGRLALKEEEGGVRDPRSYVHVRPGRTRSGDAPEMVAEVCDGRVFVRYSEPGVVDRGCLIRRDTTDRAQPKDEVKIRGCRVTLAPGVTIAGIPSSGDGATIAYPDTEPFRPEPDLPVAFSISPKRLAAVARALAALGATSVDVLLPRARGGPIGLRAISGAGEVEGIIVAESLFGATSDDVPTTGSGGPPALPGGTAGELPPPATGALPGPEPTPPSSGSGGGGAAVDPGLFGDDLAQATPTDAEVTDDDSDVDDDDDGA